MEFAESRAGAFTKMNEASLANRPWIKNGYSFRPASQHDPAGHEFRALHPYFGWVQAQVGDLDFTMFSNNDDGVAMVYHAFGPNSYEAASVAAWASIAPKCVSIADIGSFTGLFAILGQRFSPNATVIAVEPNSAARARLYINLIANGCYPSVRVAPYAVSKEVGTLPLHIAWGPDILDTGSSLHASENQTRSEIVTAAPIDVILRQFEMPPLDLIKIDVEGLEDIALLGAHDTLSKQPTLFLEIQDAKRFANCLRLLASHDYNIMAIDDYDLKLIPYQGEDIAIWFRQNVGARVLNFLCVAKNEHLILADSAITCIRQSMAK